MARLREARWLSRVGSRHHDGGCRPRRRCCCGERGRGGELHHGQGGHRGWGREPSPRRRSQGSCHPRRGCRTGQGGGGPASPPHGQYAPPSANCNHHAPTIGSFQVPTRRGLVSLIHCKFGIMSIA